MENDVRRLALQNAVKYQGKANPKAVFGAVLKEVPGAKDDLDATRTLIDEIIKEVNALSGEEQKKILLAFNPDHFDQQKEQRSTRRVERKSLPPLKDAEQGKVITRIPPEPSKYPHVGHAISFLINYLYAQMYEGRCLLRFDDTNPEKSSEEYVDAVMEDVVDFLDVKVSDTIFASDHMSQYYEFADRLVKEGLAYVCSCPQDRMSLLRREMSPCEHTELDVEQNAALWEEMKAGKQEEIVLRLRSDMAHKNAVMRDPALFRVSMVPHYRCGTQFFAWPLYDFESAVEEGLNRITHVLRGNEFATRVELQQHLHQLLHLPTAVYKEYGRYSIAGATTKGREIRELIETGQYLGWDDPRLVTIRALRRRGIVKETFYELARTIGMSKTQTVIDYSVIAALNRRILDRSARRLFLLEDPVRIRVEDVPSSVKEFVLSFHPEVKNGERKLPASGEFLLERKDVESFKEGQVIRFMDALNVVKRGKQYMFHSLEVEEYRSAPQKGPIVHYLPVGSDVKARILMDDASQKDVMVEKTVSALSVGDVVQFERWGFARLDQQGSIPLFWFAHR